MAMEVPVEDAAFAACCACTLWAAYASRLVRAFPVYALCVHASCIAALINMFSTRHQPAQQWLHTMFVGLNLYGSVHTHDQPRVVCATCTVLMLACRCMYGRCVFLWWNTPPRNLENDLFSAALLFVNLSRRPMHSGKARAAFATVCALTMHYIDDHPRSAFVMAAA